MVIATGGPLRSPLLPTPRTTAAHCRGHPSPLLSRGPPRDGHSPPRCSPLPVTIPVHRRRRVGYNRASELFLEQTRRSPPSPHSRRSHLPSSTISSAAIVDLFNRPTSETNNAAVLPPDQPHQSCHPPSPPLTIAADLLLSPPSPHHRRQCPACHGRQGSVTMGGVPARTPRRLARSGSPQQRHPRSPADTYLSTPTRELEQ